MRTKGHALAWSSLACRYLVRCAGNEIKATWDVSKQARHGDWQDGILISKSRWSNDLETLDEEPFSTAKVRADVPVMMKNSCLFVTLANQIHWSNGRQVIDRPSNVVHQAVDWTGLLACVTAWCLVHPRCLLE